MRPVAIEEASAPRAWSESVDTTIRIAVGGVPRRALFATSKSDTPRPSNTFLMDWRTSSSSLASRRPRRSESPGSRARLIRPAKIFPPPNRDPAPTTIRGLRVDDDCRRSARKVKYDYVIQTGGFPGFRGPGRGPGDKQRKCFGPESSVRP